jgi:hypothetical protein
MESVVGKCPAVTKQEEEVAMVVTIRRSGYCKISSVAHFVMAGIIGTGMILGLVVAKECFAGKVISSTWMLPLSLMLMTVCIVALTYLLLQVAG